MVKSNVDTLRFIGLGYYKLKKYEKAKEYLQKAVQLMPSDQL